jgi:hypothetical protein
MGLGTAFRLHRLLAHCPRRPCLVAVDRGFGYRPPAAALDLADLPGTLAKVMPGDPWPRWRQRR